MRRVIGAHVPISHRALHSLMRTLAVLLISGWALGAPVVAAQEASPYVPLQHWTMPYVEQLIARGVIKDPTPLTRPLRESDLVKALQAADTARLTPAVRTTLLRVLLAFDSSRRSPRYRVIADLGAAVATYMKRDPLAAVDTAGPRQSGPKHGTVSGGLDLTATFGPIVAVSHPYFDTRLKYDPDWYGKKTRFVAGRTAEAYLSAQWRWGELFFGTLGRNWGPAEIQGLLLSDNPYDFDHLAFTVGTRAFQLQAIATQLDDRTDTTGALVHRYMMQHRVWVRLPGRWTAALWEGSVWSGPGRQAEPWYLNVVGLGLLEQENRGQTVNVNNFLGFDFQRVGSITVYGQFMLDDIQVHRYTAADLKPTSYAFTTGARGTIANRSITWNAFYTQVSNLAYRNENSLQVPLYLSVGTGRNFDDYDQATLRIGLLPRAGLLVEPELTILRQGEGDSRLPYPPISAYPTTPTIFQGVVERTVRAAVSASYSPDSHLGLTADAGLHHITNYMHVVGQARTRVVASVGVTYRLVKVGNLPSGDSPE